MLQGIILIPFGALFRRPREEDSETETRKRAERDRLKSRAESAGSLHEATRENTEESLRGKGVHMKQESKHEGA